MKTRIPRVLARLNKSKRKANKNHMDYWTHHLCTERKEETQNNVMLSKNSENSFIYITYFWSNSHHLGTIQKKTTTQKNTMTRSRKI